MSEGGQLTLLSQREGTNGHELSVEDQLFNAEIDGWNSVYHEKFKTGEETFFTYKRGQLSKAFDFSFTRRTFKSLRRLNIKSMDDCTSWRVGTYKYYRGFAICPDRVSCGSHLQTEKLALDCLMELRIALGLNKHFTTDQPYASSFTVIEDAVDVLVSNGYELNMVREEPLKNDAEPFRGEIENKAVKKDENTYETRLEEARKFYSETVKLKKLGYRPAEISEELGIKLSRVNSYLLMDKRGRQVGQHNQRWTRGLSGRALIKIVRLGYTSKDDCMVWAGEKFETYMNRVLDPTVMYESNEDKEIATRWLTEGEFNSIREWLGAPKLHLRFSAKERPSKSKIEIAIFIATRNGYTVHSPTGHFHDEVNTP